MTQPPINIVPSRKIFGPATRNIIGILLFILGLQAWLILGHAIWGRNDQGIALLIILALTAIPPIARYVAIALDSIRRWTGRYPNLTAALIASAAIPFLYNAAKIEAMPLFPRWHDEFVYLIQAHMMAHGRLWMPHHPLARFFDSLYLITGRVYAPMYFPGTALMLTPAIWLGLPKYASPLIIAGIYTGLIFRVVTEIFDGVIGILASFILVSLPYFRLTSTMVLSHTCVLLLGLLMVLAYLRWRNTARSNRWLIILAIATGWAAITRPLDALCYALPIAAAMIFHLRRQPLAAWTKTAAIFFPIVLAFLSIQLVFNIGVTGHWNLTPFSDYTHRQFPGINFGLSSPVPNAQPESDLPQIRQFYRDFMVPVTTSRQFNTLLPDFVQKRLPMLWNLGFPDPFFWFLVPFSLLGLFKKQAWVLWSVLPLALLAYTAWSLLPHYLVPFFPSIIILLLTAIPAAISFFPAQAHRIQCALVPGILVLCILSWPQIDRTASDPSFHVVELQQINDTLQQIQPPAIVLFHYHNGDFVNGRRIVNLTAIEPVYNTDVAWPDDAPIIRAHDRNADTSALGTPADQNRPLYQYYANINPHRIVYLYDRLYPASPGQLKPLGAVGDLARATAPNNTPR